MSFDLEKLKQSVIDGNAAGALDLTRQALEEHVPLELILNGGLIAAMSEVGKQFEEGTFYIPEMLIAAALCRRAWTSLNLCSRLQMPGRLLLW